MSEPAARARSCACCRSRRRSTRRSAAATRRPARSCGPLTSAAPRQPATSDAWPAGPKHARTQARVPDRARRSALAALPDARDGILNPWRPAHCEAAQARHSAYAGKRKRVAGKNKSSAPCRLRWGGRAQRARTRGPPSQRPWRCGARASRDCSAARRSAARRPRQSAGPEPRRPSGAGAAPACATARQGCGTTHCAGAGAAAAWRRAAPPRRAWQGAAPRPMARLPALRRPAGPSRRSRARAAAAIRRCPAPAATRTWRTPRCRQGRRRGRGGYPAEAPPRPAPRPSTCSPCRPARARSGGLPTRRPQGGHDTPRATCRARGAPAQHAPAGALARDASVRAWALAA